MHLIAEWMLSGNAVRRQSNSRFLSTRVEAHSSSPMIDRWSACNSSSNGTDRIGQELQGFAYNIRVWFEAAAQG